jgi:hypothetical protein
LARAGTSSTVRAALNKPAQKRATRSLPSYFVRNRGHRHEDVVDQQGDQRADIADWYTRANSATIAFSSAESATGGRWSPPAGWRWC